MTSTENGTKQSKPTTSIRKHIYEYDGAAVNGQNEEAYGNQEHADANGIEN